MKPRDRIQVLALLAAFLPCSGADTSIENQIGALAASLKPRLVERRRDFHMHPELSNREERTSKVVAEHLRSLGFTDVKTGVAKYGVVAILKGDKPGPVIAVRADMDGLPIQEVNDVPYKSQNPGVKHACGHDAHTAIQLGVAEVLLKLKPQLPGTVKFIFQPAEEGVPPGEEGGALQMVKENVLEAPRPAAIFGLHCWPQVEVGQIAYASGPAMASTERMEITIHGKMAHGGAYPHRGIDAIVVAAEAINGR
jgi:amidohydrolase